MEKVGSPENREKELLHVCATLGPDTEKHPSKRKINIHASLWRVPVLPYLKNLSAIPDSKGHSGGETRAYLLKGRGRSCNGSQL